MILKYLKFSLLSTAIIIASCNSNPQPEETVSEDAMMDETIEEMEEEAEDFPFILPSPLQIASIFKKSGLTYSPDLTNDPANVTKYASQLSKSLAFGSYSADLSYCVLNNQSQKSLEYMKVVRQLADELGISAIFSSESLFKSFEKNLGNEDSIVDILAKVQEQLDYYLEENGTQYMSAVYFSGGWIESMYIGSQVISKSNKPKLASRLVEQMTILDMIVKGLDYNPNKTTELEALKTDLKSIYDIYAEFEVAKKIEAGDDTVLEDMKISDDEFSKISTKISEVRNKIING